MDRCSRNQNGVIAMFSGNGPALNPADCLQVLKGSADRAFRDFFRANCIDGRGGSETDARGNRALTSTYAIDLQAEVIMDRQIEQADRSSL